MSIGLVSKPSKFGYTPGSFYKRFQQSNMRKMNRQAVESYASAASGAVPLLFEAKSAESQGKSELVAQQLLGRIQAETQAKQAAASGLGAFAAKSV
jgi:hypothetical protein